LHPLHTALEPTPNPNLAPQTPHRSCFADLALTSPVEYFKDNEGSLMQCVITPAAPYMSWTNEAIA